VKIVQKYRKTRSSILKCFSAAAFQALGKPEFVADA